MNTLASRSLTSTLASYRGPALFSAAEAILKGLLESESESTLVAAPRAEPATALIRLAADELVGGVLRRHGTRVTAVPTAGRGLSVAWQAARSGRSGVALVPNEDLDRAASRLQMMREDPLTDGGTLAVLFEDRPRACPARCPRSTLRDLGWPTLEPEDVDGLRRAMESAPRLSRAGSGPVGLVVHSSIFRAVETLESGPNRVAESVDELLARRKRRRGPRWTEAGDVLRIARRLELNTALSLPSPGERVPVGFIVVGPAGRVLAHLVQVLRLHGRVPILQLRLIHPIDESAVGRFLGRCEQVVVLEPRPGSVEAAILDAAEGLRRRGEPPASVWGRRVPPDAEGREVSIDPDQALHPSVLVRKIVHLLHRIRPNLQVASRLLPDLPPVDLPIARRGSGLGPEAAVAFVRGVLGEVAQEFAQRETSDDETLEPTALWIDGIEPQHAATRAVMAEVWDDATFVNEGLSALRHAARSDRPWIFAVCVLDADEAQDLERLVQGSIPGARAERVRIETASLADRTELRDTLTQAAQDSRMTVAILHDGPPARFDAVAIEQQFAEIDRLGFQPRQRLVWSAGQACSVGGGVEDRVAAAPGEPEPELMRTKWTTSRLGRGERSEIRLRVQPLLEEVVVLRSKPPARAPLGETTGLTPPTPVHAAQSQWRAHIAGCRGPGSGLVATALCEAGHRMGYAVRCLHDPQWIGPGRRAWAQILFTRPSGRETTGDLTAAIPYGEADLLLGVDLPETVRAIGPNPDLRVAYDDRTAGVINLGHFDEPARGEPASPPRVEVLAALRAVTLEEHSFLEDFAEACRACFHTDRVTDLVLLGAAFQRGLVPVTIEAMESAVHCLEASGYGRASDAFQFGRRVALDEKQLARAPDDPTEEVESLARRLSLSIGRRGGREGKELAHRFERLVRKTLEQMPGLTETDPGRQARRVLVRALYGCLVWGGIELSRTYAGLVTALYHADRGDKGRALTREAILPAAECLLIRDPIFIAAMTGSAEHRRRLRRKMNIKHARGDRLERRYLTRIEMTFLRRRFLAELRTSDWPARFVTRLGQLVPNRWRGTRAERAVRDYVLDLIDRAAAGAAEDYDSWQALMHTLHGLAVDGQLRTMSQAQLMERLEPAPPPGALDALEEGL